MQKFRTIDEYILAQPVVVQDILQQVRIVVRRAAVDAIETISYQMPTYRLCGKNLVHFAAFSKHIGFYPTPSAVQVFSNEIQLYKHAKGSIQFPLSQPMPLKLIEAITAFRRQEVLNVPAGKNK